MNEKLLKYYQLQKAIFESHFSKITKSTDAEVVHQLRLSVKRIRALFTFLSFIEGKKKGRKHLRELKAIYKPTGVIRDTQVQVDLIKTYEERFIIKYDKYLDYLNKRINAGYKNLKNASQQDFSTPLIELESLVNKIISKHSEEELHENVNDIIGENLAIIRNLNKLPTEKEKHLHEIRRILKEMRYLLDIFKDSIKEVKSLKVGLKRLKEIEKTLGKWHDQLNGELLLDGFIDDLSTEDKGEIKKYKLLRKSITRDKLLFLERIQYAFRHELGVE